MSGGPDITEWPSLKAAWGLFLSCRVWGCCAVHRRQASSYSALTLGHLLCLRQWPILSSALLHFS